MIDLFEVRNFKSIKAMTMEMRPFMVLVGPNGAGKTNVVHALELFGDILQRGTTDPAREQGWDEIIRREKKPARGGISFRIRTSIPAPRIYVQHKRNAERQESPARQPGPERLTAELALKLEGRLDSNDVIPVSEALTLQGQHGTLHLGVEGNDAIVDLGEDRFLHEIVADSMISAVFHKDLFADRATVDRSLSEILRQVLLSNDREDSAGSGVLRLLNPQRWFSPFLVDHLARTCRVMRLRLDTSALRQDGPTGPRGANLLGHEGQGLPAAIDRLRGHGATPDPAFRQVLAALQRVYPRIEDVRAEKIQPGKMTLFFKERGIQEELGVASVSDGVLHALALLMMLEGSPRSAGILAIEEPENAIHPWSVQAMVRRVQESPGRQVLLTTHSETVVNAVKDPGALHVVENDDRLGTVVTPALDRERALKTILSESGQNLGDVWMDGSLGGVPKGEP